MFQAFSLCGTCSESERLRIAFADCYKKDYPKAAGRLLADWDHMATIYSYPEEHWVCIWTTKVVESPLISARLRTDAAERLQNATAMIWKLLHAAVKKFLPLEGH